MRKRRAVKRDVLADPIYNSKLVTKLINTIMLDGKKTLFSGMQATGNLTLGNYLGALTVSYTHLTLPTILRV